MEGTTQAKRAASVAEALAKAYHVFAQLGNPLSSVEFPHPDEFNDAPPSVAQAMQIAREAFRIKCPVREEMSGPLLEVDRRIEEELPPLSLEGAFLRFFSRLWLQAIQAVDPLASRARLRVQLAPSLWPSQEHEEEGRLDEKSAGRYVRLPIAICNHGPGTALNVEVQIEKSEQFLLDNSPNKVPLGSIKCDETKVITFRLHQGHEEGIEVKLKITYGDFVRDLVTEFASFGWPPFTKDVLGPIDNPFVIGRPLGNKAEWNTIFLGRGEQLRRLRKAVVSVKGPGGFVLVKGLRRVGKTSLLLQFKDVIREDGFLPVYMNC